MEIAKRSDDTKGFSVLPRRWVVERTSSRFGRNRRPANDLEKLAETLATFITVASTSLPSGGLPGGGRKLKKPPVGKAPCRRSANRIVKEPSPERPTFRSRLRTLAEVGYR